MIKIIISYILLCLLSFAVFSQDQKKKNETGQGVGSGSGDISKNSELVNATPTVAKTKSKNRTLKILTKPRAIYTDQARTNQIMGVIRLQITFKKNGEIGIIKVIKGLPNGLTQNAIEAAKGIKFEPEIKNWKPVTVSKVTEYSFTLY